MSIEDEIATAGRSADIYTAPASGTAVRGTEDTRPAKGKVYPSIPVGMHTISYHI